MKGLFGRRQMIDNKGFSLVELLIAVAIASIVGASVFGFMTVGAKTFGRTSTDVHIQNEAQLAFNQIQDLMIDTVVGIDYVYINTGQAFSDDSNKVITDADIPDLSNVIGKKLIMYNTSASGRKIYEVVWKKEDQKLYYNEYEPVADIAAGTVVKGARIGDADALMAEFVTDFKADLSLAENKRVARVEISYERSGRPYTSSHNITLRNKIVSGNNIPQYMVSENTVPLSKDVYGPDEIYAEPGDVCDINSDYTVKDVNGDPVATTKYWQLDPSDPNYSTTAALGTEVTPDGQVRVSQSQKEDFSLLVYSGDGLAHKTVTVKIIRIETIDGISWEHQGTIGKGEVANVNTPSKDDLIEKEEFKLTVTGMTVKNDGRTSYNGNTVEKKVVFIKTAGEDLFDIVSQDGESCICKMKDSFGTSVGGLHRNGETNVSTAPIAVTAVSVYSLGGRGFSSPTTANLKKTDFNYDSATSDPRSIGASNYLSGKRYCENGSVKPVTHQWDGTAYMEESSFNITTNGKYKRGQHQPILFQLDGRSGTMDILTRASNGDSIVPNDYAVVVDIALTDKLYKQTRDGFTYSESTIYPYSDTTWVGGESANWGLICPEKYSANSEFTYTITYYLFKVQNLDSGSINDAANRYKKNLEHHQTYVREWDSSKASGTVSTGTNNIGYNSRKVNMSPDDLEKYDYVSNALPVTFSRLKLTYKHHTSGNDPFFDIVGDDNENADQSVKFYAKPFKRENLWNQQSLYFDYTHTNQFKIARNYLTFNYYQMVNGDWMLYGDPAETFYKTGSSGDVIIEKAGGSEESGEIIFKYTLGNFTNKTPKHLRLVPSYVFGNDANDILFDSDIDIYLWNIEIPEIPYKKGNDNKKTKAEVSYFPSPSDTAFPDPGIRQAWIGALSKNDDDNKNAPAILYTLQKVENGISGQSVPSYNLTLEYMKGLNDYYVIGTYKYDYDNEYWKKTGN